MAHALLVSVRFHDGRYHGHPEWPPSPARLFQALVAAAANGATLTPVERAALVWLENLSEAPIIVAPRVRLTKAFQNYVPNNDLDAVQGDPRRIGEIRTAKLIKPLLFDSSLTVLYAWQFAEDDGQARQICNIAERLYQLGRGVDMACAWADIIESAELEMRLVEHGGTIYRPGGRDAGPLLLCPRRGSLKSLENRFSSLRERFRTIRQSRQVQQVFVQAPRPRFEAVSYENLAHRYLFEIRDVLVNSAFAPWPLGHISALVEHVRNRSAEKLKERLPHQNACIDRVFIGRNSHQGDKAERIKIVPLPSIGSLHVERSVRRVLLEVPPNCPLRKDDIAWAFSNLSVSEQIHSDTGEVVRQTALVPTDDLRMLSHYGIGSANGDAYRNGAQ